MAIQKNKSGNAGVNWENPKILLWILALLTFLLYANTLSNGYNLDDELVTNNHALTSKGISAIPEIIRSPYYQDAMGYQYGYRPVVHISFAIEHSIFGQNPGISHFINAVLMVLVVCLLFRFLLQLAGDSYLIFAFLASILFAFHPIHTEAVASIKNRDELLSLLFAILSGQALLGYLDKKNWIYLIAVFLLFALALLSKKSVYPLTIALLAGIVWFRAISAKDLVWMMLVFVLPTPFILGEWQLQRFIPLLVTPVVVNFLVYFVKPYFESGERKVDWRILVQNPYFYLVSAFVFIELGFFTSNFLLALVGLAIPMFFFQWKMFNAYAGLGFAFLFYLSGALFDYQELLDIGLIVGFFYFAGNLKESESPNLRQNLLFLALLSSIFLILSYVFVTPDQNFNNFYKVLMFSVLWFFSRRKYSLVFYIPVVVISLYYVITDWSHSNDFYSLTVDLFFVFMLVDSLKKDLRITWRLASISLSILVFYFLGITQWNFLQEQKKQQVELSQVLNKQPIRVKKANQEGRNLEYMENTLVAPHSPTEGVATGILLLGEYAKLMVFPKDLSFYYGFAKEETTGLDNPWVWLSALVYLGILILLVFFLDKQPLVSFGLGWYLVSVLLFSNWFEYIAGMMGERLAFTASAGFCMALAGVILWIKPSFSIRKPAGMEWGVLAVLLVFAVKVYSRNAQWKNELVLMQNDIEHLQESAQANNLLATNLMKYSFLPKYASQSLAMRNEAVQHFEKAIQIYPLFFNAWFDLGRAYLEVQQPDKAYTCFERVIEMDSTYTDAHMNMVSILLNKGKLDEAEALLLKVKQRNPNYKELYLNLGFIQYKRGNKQEAIKIYDEAIQFNPAWVEPYQNNVVIYLELQDTLKAKSYHDRIPK